MFTMISEDLPQQCQITKRRFLGTYLVRTSSESTIYRQGYIHCQLNLEQNVWNPTLYIQLGTPHLGIDPRKR
jgi:hypothetical protein